MFEVKLSEKARIAVDYAKEEAIRLGSDQIDTEHLLLGLMRNPCQAAVIIHGYIGFAFEKFKREIETLSPKHIVPDNVGQTLCFTQAADRVFQYAMEEAEKIGYYESNEFGCIGTEHILLGLIRNEDCIAAKVLIKFGVTLEQIYRILGLPTRPKGKQIYLSTQQRTIDLNNVDEEIRDLVALINEVPFLETCSSCSGHPSTHEREWRNGWICIAPTGDIGQVWDFLEFILARVDNTLGSESSQNGFHVNQALKLYQQIGGETLYSSAIPILTTNFSSSFVVTVPYENLPVIWNNILKVTQDFTSSREKLPSIETAKIGVETFVNLLQSVPHVRETTAVLDKGLHPYDPDGIYPDTWWAVEIHYLWRRDSVKWGWDFMENLKAHFYTHTKVLNNFSSRFLVSPIAIRKDFQRTQEDHLKIWKLIELAIQEAIHRLKDMQ